MKNYYVRRLLSALVVMLACITSYAYDFSNDGIYYKITSSGEVAVTYGDSYSGTYSGDITVPKTVTYDGTTYSVTSVGDTAFYACTSVTSVSLPEGITSIGLHAFCMCRKATSINLPSTLTSIGKYAFYFCPQLTSVEIPEGVTVISEGAFQSCYNVTSLTMGDNVTRIRSYGLANMSSLKKVVLPASMESISKCAFDGDTALDSVYCYALDAPTAYDNTFTDDTYSSAVLCVPSTSVDEYKAATCWMNFVNIAGDLPGEEETVVTATATASADTITLGESVTLTATVEGLDDVTYQWKYYNGSDESKYTTSIGDANSAELTFTPDEYTGGADSYYLFCTINEGEDSELNTDTVCVVVLEAEEEEEEEEEQGDVNGSYPDEVGIITIVPADSSTIAKLDTVRITFEDFDAISYGSSPRVYSVDENGNETWLDNKTYGISPVATAEGNVLTIALTDTAIVKAGNYYVRLDIAYLTTDGGTTWLTETYGTYMYIYYTVDGSLDTAEEDEEEEASTGNVIYITDDLESSDPSIFNVVVGKVGKRSSYGITYDGTTYYNAVTMADTTDMTVTVDGTYEMKLYFIANNPSITQIGVNGDTLSVTQSTDATSTSSLYSAYDCTDTIYSGTTHITRISGPGCYFYFMVLTEIAEEEEEEEEDSTPLASTLYNLTIDPENGSTVESLSAFSVTFDDYTTVNCTSYPYVYTDDSLTVNCTVDGYTVYAKPSVSGNTINFTLNKAVTDNGTYYIQIKSGKVVLDNTTSTEEDIIVTYTVDSTYVESAEEDLTTTVSDSLLIDSVATYEANQVLTGANCTVTLGNDTWTNKGANSSAGEPYYAYITGAENPKDDNGSNYSAVGMNVPTTGAYVIVSPSTDGTVEAGLVVNSGKPFYVAKGSTGEMVDPSELTFVNGDGETVEFDEDAYTFDAKFYGTVTFTAEADEDYYIFCTGSKIGFYGVIFPAESVESEEEDVQIAMINPVEGSTVDSLYAGDYVQFTIEPNDEVGYAYYKINSVTGEVHTTRSTLTYESSTGYWQSEVVYDKAFTDSLYYVIVAAYASESDYNYDRDAIAEDTFIIYGGAEEYQYSAFTMVSADPENEDTVYLYENSDLECVYTFDGPVTMDSEDTYVVYGQGITYNFSKFTAGSDAEEINGTTYSTEWTLTVDNSTLYEFMNDWITLCIVPMDTTGARVLGNEGEDNQTYFRMEYYLDVVSEPEVAITLTASDPEDEATVEALSTMYFTASGIDGDLYVNDDAIDDIMVYSKTTGDTYEVSTVTVDGTTVCVALNDTITTTGITITVSLPEGLVGDTAANKKEFMTGIISADTVFYYTIGTATEDEVVTVVPAEGIVDSLASFKVTFESHSTIGASWYYYPQLLNEDGEAIKTWNLEGSDTTSTDGCIPFDWNTWTGSNSVYLNLESVITDAGTYTLYIPEGTFIFDDIADSVNDSITFTYVIEATEEESDSTDTEEEDTENEESEDTDEESDDTDTDEGTGDDSDTEDGSGSGNGSGSGDEEEENEESEETANIVSDSLLIDSLATYEANQVLTGANCSVTLGNADWNAPVASADAGEPYYAYITGIVNPTDDSGSKYTVDNKNVPTVGQYVIVTPGVEGTVEAGLTINSSKPFYVVKGSTGEALDESEFELVNADGETVTRDASYQLASKFYGTLTFDAEAGENYYIFCTGSKISFYGVVFSYESAESDTESEDETGISNVSASETTSYNVYTISGMHVMNTSDKSDLKSLPMGIYIVNGKKIAIK